MDHKLEHRILTGLDSAFQKRIDGLQVEFAEQLQKDCTVLVDRAVQEAEIHAAEKLSAAARRLRSEDSVTGVAAALVETTAHYAGRAALLIHKGDRLLGFKAEGLTDAQDSAFHLLDIPIADAAAIAHAVDTKDPVVTTGSANELSASLAEVLDVQPGSRVHLFPIVLRDSVLAVLYADEVGSDHEPETAAIELLTSLAEAWIEAVGARGKQPASTAPATNGNEDA